MRSKLTGFFLAMGLMLPAETVLAHHSTAMYNMENPVTVTGVVKRFEWTNPHAYIYMDVKDENGKTVEWAIEMMSLNHLKSYGWAHDMVKAGETISCTGGQAHSGLPAMLISLVKLGDGRLIKA